MKKTLLLLAIMTFFALRIAAPVSAMGNESDPAAQIPTVGPIQNDTRIPLLKAFLHSYNSPLEENARTFVEEADRNHIDWRLVAAIAGVESTFGKDIPAESFNAWGWGVFTGAQDGTHFTDWAQGIAQVSKGLRLNYFNHGAQSLYDVGCIYAANGYSWSSHVQFFIDKINEFVPNDPQYLDVNI